MSSNIDVSSIVCVLAEGAWKNKFRDTLSAVIRSISYASCNVEIIIATTGSIKEARELVKDKIPNNLVLVFYSFNKIGLYKTINKVLKFARGAAVNYVHIGDSVSDNFYSKMWYSFYNQPNSLPFCRVNFVDQGRILWCRNPPLYFQCIQNIKNLILHPNAFYHLNHELRNPFDCIDEASDHRHINKIIKKYNLKIIRLEDCYYSFNMDGSGITMKSISRMNNFKLLHNILALYLFLFETNKFKRLFNRFFLKIKSWKK